jgi:hypothetical protein
MWNNTCVNYLGLDTSQVYIYQNIMLFTQIYTAFVNLKRKLLTLRNLLVDCFLLNRSAVTWDSIRWQLCWWVLQGNSHLSHRGFLTVWRLPMLFSVLWYISITQSTISGFCIMCTVDYCHQCSRLLVSFETSLSIMQGSYLGCRWSGK